MIIENARTRKYPGTQGLIPYPFQMSLPANMKTKIKELAITATKRDTIPLNLHSPSSDVSWLSQTGIGNVFFCGNERPKRFLLCEEKAGSHCGLRYRFFFGLVVIKVVVVVGSPQTGHDLGNLSLLILTRTRGSLKIFLYLVN